MLRGIYGDRRALHRQTYFSSKTPEGYYFAGDGARRRGRGYFWIMGRVDDVMNVSGHRLGTMEVESAGERTSRSWKRRWWACRTRSRAPASPPSALSSRRLRRPGDAEAASALKATLREHVAKEIGAIAKPDIDPLRGRRSPRPAPARSCGVCSADDRRRQGADHPGHDHPRGLLGAGEAEGDRGGVAVRRAHMPVAMPRSSRPTT